MSCTKLWTGKACSRVTLWSRAHARGPRTWVEQLRTSGGQRLCPAPEPCAQPPRSRALRRRQTLAVPSSEPLASRSRVAGENARSNTRALWPAPAAAALACNKEHILMLEGQVKHALVVACPSTRSPCLHEEAESRHEGQVKHARVVACPRRRSRWLQERKNLAHGVGKASQTLAFPQSDT